MLPATLLPVTEPTILVVPVPARSEASAPACQPRLTSSDISASPEVNLDSMVATQVKLRASVWEVSSIIQNAYQSPLRLRLDSKWKLYVALLIQFTILDLSTPYLLSCLSMIVVYFLKKYFGTKWNYLFPKYLFQKKPF